PLYRQVRRGRVVPFPGFQVWMDLSRPESRGAIRLRSSDPATPPSIVFNHLESRQDVQDSIDGGRLARQLFRQPSWTRYGPTEVTPGPDVSSDADIERFLRARVGTSYHASGACRMGSDVGAVVDS